ncbi:MAG: methyltransferase, partial [Bacteroidales bacterium]|nr:methyltransferase [Bacteroidales bacterium]
MKHDCSAMKVGTDGVLLGAWAELPSSGTILDVGCGCGLIALMSAQRLSSASCDFRIIGVDVDEGSIQDAVENFAASPWRDALQAVQADFLSYAATLPADSVDAVLSNPPYFSEDLLSPHARRNLSRHAESLPFGELLLQVQRLLKQGGTLAMVLPPRAYAQIESLLPETAPSLRLQRLTRVYFKEGKACGRLLAQWKKFS